MTKHHLALVLVATLGDGTDFETEFPFMSVRSDGDTVVLVDDGRTVAASGDTVTVFGGMDEAGTFAVCSIQERHAQ